MLDSDSTIVSCETIMQIKEGVMIRRPLHGYCDRVAVWHLVINSPTRVEILSYNLHYNYFKNRSKLYPSILLSAWKEMSSARIYGIRCPPVSVEYDFSYPIHRPEGGWFKTIATTKISKTHARTCNFRPCIQTAQNLSLFQTQTVLHNSLTKGVPSHRNKWAMTLWFAGSFW